MIGNARTFVPPLEKTGCPDNVHETHLHAPRHPSACLADRAARAAQKYGNGKKMKEAIMAGLVMLGSLLAPAATVVDLNLSLSGAMWLQRGRLISNPHCSPEIPDKTLFSRLARGCFLRGIMPNFRIWNHLRSGDSLPPFAGLGIGSTIVPICRGL